MSFFSKWKGTLAGAALAPFTGGLSLGAGYLYDTNKQQNKANQKAVDRANAYDMYTWDLANQYNNPVSQMQRLKAAGLNPNLVYGSGNVTGNTTGSPGSNGIAQQEVFNGVSKGLQTAQAVAGLQNTIANNKLLQVQQEKTAADRLYTEAQTTNLNNFLTGRGNSTYSYGIDTNNQYKEEHPTLADPIDYVVKKGSHFIDWTSRKFGHKRVSNQEPIEVYDSNLPAIGRNVKRYSKSRKISWLPW